MGNFPGKSGCGLCSDDIALEPPSGDSFLRRIAAKAASYSFSMQFFYPALVWALPARWEKKGGTVKTSHIVKNSLPKQETIPVLAGSKFAEAENNAYSS